MSAPRRRYWYAVVVVVLVVAGAGAFLWSGRSNGRLAIAAASLPATPDLHTWPSELPTRIRQCEQRLREGQDAITALGELSRLYHANGFTAEACRCYEGLLQADPDQPRWAHRYAGILSGYGDLDGAVVLLRRVVAQDPPYLPARVRLGDVLFKQGEAAEATRTYGEILARDPENPFALLGLARIDIDAGRWSEARTRLERAGSKSKFDSALDLLATVYDHLGEPARAASVRGRPQSGVGFRDLPDPWIDEIVVDCYDPYRLTVVAAAAEGFGDVPSATRWLERAIALAPDDAAARRQLGQLFLRQREYTRARQQLERAVALAPGEADNWVQLIEVLKAVGDAALDQTLAAGLSRCPDSPSLHLEYGRRLKAAGRLEEALTEFEHSRRLRPQEADVYTEIASTCFRLNRMEEGMAQMQKALAVDPENPLALLTLGRYAIGRGDRAGADDWLRRARAQPRIRPQDLQDVIGAYRREFGQPPW